MQAVCDRLEDVEALEIQLAELELEEARRDYRSYCQSSFQAFVRHMEPDWVLPWFQLRLIDVFQKIADGLLNRVIISMPPRHSKTTISRLFTAWFMGRFPNRKIIGTSYNDDLASQSNRAVQAIMTSERYAEIFPRVILPSSNTRTVSSRKLRNSSVFELEEHDGSYYSAGIMGGITGRGATGGMVIDDPVKNYESATGKERDKIENEWIYTLRSRIENGAFVVIIMTRWTLNDFAGTRLTEAANNPDLPQWTEINLPAVKDDISDDTDPRELGETLWPENGYDKKWADALKAENEDAWQSQFQQRPVVIGGGILKTFKVRFWYPVGTEPAPVKMPNNEGEMIEIPQMPLPAHMGRYIQSWDLTFKKTTHGSFIVGQQWGTNAPGHPTLSFLLDQKRLRDDFEAGIEAMLEMQREWPVTRVVLVEDKANGPASQSRLKGKISGIEMVKPQGDKIERAKTCGEFHTDVVLPHPSVYPWVKGYLGEVSAFPKGVNDDQVDATTQYINWRYTKSAWKAYK